MNPTETTLIDLDLLLRDAPPPSATTLQLPLSPEPEERPSLRTRLRDEVVAKGRLVGWSECELEQIATSEDEAELLAIRERLGREIAGRFAVSPLFSTSPLPPPRRIDWHFFK